MGKGVSGGIAILISIFTALVIVISSIVSVPQTMLGGKDITVITKANDPNPLRGNLNIEIAYALKNMSFVEVVSPEIIVFSTYKGNGITIRGVWYKEFLEIEGGKLVNGRLPKRGDECIVGEGIANRLNIKLNDSLTLFGSFKSSVAIVKVVGIFSTKTLSNDEILVSIPLARNLCGLGKNAVSIIRVKSNDKEKMKMITQTNYPKFILTDVDIPMNAYLYDKIPVKFSVRNWGRVKGNTSVDISFCNKTYRKIISVNGDEEDKFVVYVNATELGNKSINISLNDKIFPYNYSAIINVSLRPLFVTYPEYLQVYHEGKIFVSSVEGPVANATVLVEGHKYKTDESGSVMVSFNTVGRKKVYVEKDGYENKTFDLKVFAYTSPQNMFRIVYPKYVSMKNISFYLVNSSRKMIFEVHNNYTNLSYGFWNSEKIPIENNTLYLSDWSDGWYNITVYAEDLYNFTWENITIYIDSVPPSVYVNYPPVSKIRPGETLIVKVGDNFNLTYSKIKISNSTFIYQNITDYLYYNNTQNFSGVYRVDVNTSDLAGNWKNITFIYIFINESDTTPPNASINTTSRSLYMSPGQSICVNLEDNFRVKNATVIVKNKTEIVKKINTNAPSIIIKTYTVDKDNLTVKYWNEGNYTIFVYAQDPYGNSYSTTESIIMKNDPDYAKPIILYDLEKNVLYTNDSFNVSFWDNYLLHKIGYYGENFSFMYSINSNHTILKINASSLKSGEYNLTLYAEDWRGNNFSVVIPIKVISQYTPKPVINYTAYLTPEEITINESAVLAVNIWNSGDAPGSLYINITIDGEIYTSSYITILPQENKSFVFNLPPLNEGKHVITVFNYSFQLMVYKYSVGDIPVEKILRYTKDIDIKAKGEAVYRALELSEGNFLLLVLSIIGTATMLLIMGISAIFSKNFRAKERNIGILRAIGATRSKILKIVLKEITIWCGIGIFVGTLSGYFIINYISSAGMIRAFGHSLSISMSLTLLMAIFIFSMFAVYLTGIIITLKLLKKRAVEIMRKIVIIEKGIELKNVWGDGN